MANLLSLILSAVLFVWEIIRLKHAYFNPQPHPGADEASLLTIRSILVFICAPFLWGSQILKYLGWLPWNDWESKNVIQMKMFAWTLNAVLVVVFVWKLFF